jgi:hypothetical protein
LTPKALEKAARAALETITSADTIGAVLSAKESDGVADVRFVSNMPGYVGWEWVASLAVDGSATSVLETELLAGVDSIQSPEWVPWVDRLREYEASIAAGVEDEVVVVPDDELDDDDDDDDDDVDDLDEEDEDDDDDDDVDDLDDVDDDDLGIDDLDLDLDNDDDDDFVVVDDR